MRALELTTLDDYARRLGEDTGERAVLDALCRIVISRFYRDRSVWEALRDALRTRGASRSAEAPTHSPFRAWSAGCACGEEPYTLVMLWQELFPARVDELEVLASDADARLLERAREGLYGPSSVRALPDAWRERHFVPAGDGFELEAALRTRVDFRVQDLRHAFPRGPFDVILCRNLAFTYFDEERQRALATRFAQLLGEGGLLVVGAHEHVPSGCGLERLPASPALWRRT